MQEKLPEKASPIVFTDEGLFQIVPSFPKSVDIIKVIGIVYSPNMSDTDPTIFREKKNVTLLPILDVAEFRES